MVEILPNTCKVLGSIPINGEREREKNRAQPSSSMHTENNKWGHKTFCQTGAWERKQSLCVAGQDAEEEVLSETPCGGCMCLMIKAPRVGETAL